MTVGTKARILFVDDEPHVLAAYRRALRSAYEVETAESGAVALRLLEERGPFAVIIADMRMPGMDGASFLAAARRLQPEASRLMLTGNADQQTAVKAVNEGHILRFLTKPCPPEALSAGIAEGVRQFSLLQAEKELVALRQRHSQELERANLELEEKVSERTQELSHAYEQLRAELAERERVEEALRRTEEQFRQAQKMEAIGRLAGGIAHDFNNLLTAIISYSDLALSNLKTGQEKTRRFVAEVKKAGERGAVMTRQLLAFSRGQVLRPEIIDLNQVVTEMHGLLSRLISGKIKFYSRPAPDLCRVTADPGQLGQVLLNLCVNARDAMPHGGRLTVETYNFDSAEADAGQGAGPARGRYAVLSVADTGCGMDAETRARIFEPFFTTKPLGEGTGLGLSTVYGIVGQLGGHVVVESKPGVGSTFRVFLPELETSAPETVLRPATSVGRVPMAGEQSGVGR